MTGMVDRFYGAVDAYVVVDRSRVWQPDYIDDGNAGPTVYGPYVEIRMADAIMDEINYSGGDAYMTALSEYTGQSERGDDE